MTSHSLTIASTEDLLRAEEQLDAMTAGLADAATFAELHRQAVDYVRANPALLSQPWPRTGGAVYDIIEAARTQALDAEEVRLSALDASSPEAA